MKSWTQPTEPNQKFLKVIHKLKIKEKKTPHCKDKKDFYVFKFSLYVLCMFCLLAEAKRQREGRGEREEEKRERKQGGKDIKTRGKRRVLS